MRHVKRLNWRVLSVIYQSIKIRYKSIIKPAFNLFQIYFSECDAKKFNTKSRSIHSAYLCQGPTLQYCFECKDKKFFKKLLDAVIWITTKIKSLAPCAMLTCQIFHQNQSIAFRVI